MNVVPPTDSELRMMRQMSGVDTASNCNFDFRRAIVPTITFFILSLHWTDDVISKFYPTTSGIMTIVKVGIFVAVILVAQLIGMA